MVELASLEDYAARYGEVDDADGDRIEVLLADASSLVASYADHLGVVEDDEVLIDGTGTRRLFLPAGPVIDVTAVEVDGEALDAEDWRVWSWGGLDRRDGRCWPHTPASVAVTYSHGLEVPAWVVGLVCGMVQRAGRPGALDGAESMQLGDAKITYAAEVAAAGTVIGVTEDELGRLGALNSMVIA